jgi:hypothetical protein
MIKRILGLLFGVKFLLFFKPNLKVVVRNIIICVIFIFFIIYIHTEFNKWSQISGNISYVSIAFIIKNALIFLSLIILLLSFRRLKPKNPDGFDKFRNMKKVRTTQEIKLEQNEKN